MSILSPSAVVLGTAQDGGYPQAGCRESCCTGPDSLPEGPLYCSSLAICDPASKKRWIIDCTPSFPRQLALLDGVAPAQALPAFLLTHAHIGHYTGLTQLGREVLNAREVDVFTLERMQEFLENNLPWKELIADGNIKLRPMEANREFELAPGIRVTPLLVPHRDEYSETTCFLVEGPKSSLLWLTDIDGWEELSPSIEELISRVDIAFLDGTFFSADELPGRDLSSISHPFIETSIARFSRLPAVQREKIRFIHLNHSNPAILPASPATKRIEQAGHLIARQGDLIEL